MSLQDASGIGVRSRQDGTAGSLRPSCPGIADPPAFKKQANAKCPDLEGRTAYPKAPKTQACQTEWIGPSLTL